MGSARDVVEISSDEEDIPMARKPPVDWVSKLFDEDDDETNRADFFDLVVMSDLSAPAVLPQKKSKSGGGGGGGGEDDDDCVLLDGDPDRAVSVREEKGSAGDSSSDELQIVAEKGPVACRDFPHSRHLCSNFPFSTTSHVKHCNMCHCFVCDAPAPCNYWGKGISTNDHCHATDKEMRWKTLRQALKCKSAPTSHPEKYQNAVYPTMTSPRQQDIQCQVSVPQSHPPLSNTVRSSLANRSPLLNVVSQNQQTSVRVSLNVGQTVSTPRASPGIRAGRNISNVHTAQTHSRGRFKRAGAASPGHTIRNANQFGSHRTTGALPLMHKALPHASQPVQAATRTNAFTGMFQNNAPQRSLSAPIASQGPQNQPVPSCLASNGVHGIGPQLSRCTSLMTQRTQFLPELMDVSTQSWQDILSSVANVLEIDDSDYNTSTAQSQQPSTQPLHSSANQGVNLHAESIVDLMTSNGHDLPSHSTGGDVLANAPMQTTQTLNPLNYQSSLIPNEDHLDSFVSSPGEGLLIEAAHQRESSGLDSTGVMFDFELDGFDLSSALAD